MHRVLKVPKEEQEHRVHKVYKALKETQEHKVLKEHKEQLVLKVQ